MLAQHIGPDHDSVVHTRGFVFFGVKREDELHDGSLISVARDAEITGISHRENR